MQIDVYKGHKYGVGSFEDIMSQTLDTFLGKKPSEIKVFATSVVEAQRIIDEHIILGKLPNLE